MKQGKRTMKHGKRKLAVIAVIAIVLTLFAQGTVAYFSHVGKATNVVTSGNIQFIIHETTNGGGLFPSNGVVVLPGDVVEKKVTFESDCTHPFYLRAKLTYAVNDTTLTAADCFAPDINTTDWEYHDGWYYYKAIVEPGKTTTELLSDVTIVGDKVDNAYIGKKLTLSVVAQAVQSEHNPLTDGHTYTALGWPA